MTETKRCTGNCPNTCKVHDGEFTFCSNGGCLCHVPKTAEGKILGDIIEDKKLLMTYDHTVPVSAQSLTPEELKKAQETHTAKVIRVPVSGEAVTEKVPGTQTTMKYVVGFAPQKVTTPTPPPTEGWEAEYDVLLKDFLVQQLAWEKSEHTDILRGSPVLQEMAEVRYKRLKDFIRETITQALAEQKARMVEEIKQELERLRQVRILIPKNVGGNSKCITEGYHRCLDKVDKFIKALSK